VPRLTRGERRRLGVLATAIAGLHAVGGLILLVLVVPQHLSLGGHSIFGIGLGLTAYVLGLRHAVDADHICAIDNTTRKLMADGKRPLTVGFFFSLGHSSVVFVLALMLSLGIGALATPVEHGGSGFHTATGVIGTTVSGAFLYLIALLNTLILVRILRAVKRARRGRIGRSDLATELAGGGTMSRIYRRLTKAVREPWQMYPIGVLFGLGFDTATEVALLFLAAGAAWSRLPVYAVLCLPILFAAGMTLVDTLDGCFMARAYGWALTNPVRKIYFNVTITALSVFVALAVGSAELMSVLASRLRLSGSAWRLVATLNLNTVGLMVIGMFAIAWLVALVIWQVAHIEERWAPVNQPPGASRE
jgi:high-affinity nickel-transport protein